MNRSCFYVAMAGAFVFAAPAGGQDARATRMPIDAPVDTLQPGDLIRLRIWREPDLSGEFPIDEDGVAVFPRLGPIRVVSMSTDSLQQFLVSTYSVHLRNPSIEVTVLRRVNVLGAVRSPGLYPVDPTMTVADAIALAGGVTPEGKSDQVDLIRGGDKLSTRISRRTRIAESPIRSGDQLYVPERSWASRNAGIVAAAISAGASVLVALLLR